MELWNEKVYNNLLVKFDDLGKFSDEITSLFQFQGLHTLLIETVNFPSYTKVVLLFYAIFQVGSNYNRSTYVYIVKINIYQ